MRSYIERIASLSPEKLKLLERRAPLSFAQQRLWFLDRLRPGDPLYNVPAAVRLTGDLNVHALERAFAEVVARHDALRTVFPAFDGRPLQIVIPPQPFALSVLDLSDVEETDREARVRQLTDEEASFQFNLSEGPLYRVSLLRLGAQEHVLLLTLHHIVSDGWSIGVLINEVTKLYRAFARGESSPLPALPIQYADYARWQREWLAGDVLEQQLDYWKNQLASLPPVLELPTDRPRPVVRTHQGATFDFDINADVSAALASLSRREGVTTFMTLLAAFQALLARYSRQDDIAVGSVVAGRSRVETEPLIGCFVNTLVLRTDLSGDPTFTELLSRAREVTLGAYAHQDIPFEKLVDELQPERSASHTPLFQVMLVLQNTPDEGAGVPGLRLEQLAAENRNAKFDLLLTVSEGRRGLAATFEYSAELFDEPTIRRMAGHFTRLLEAVAADPQQRLSRVRILGEEEREELLNVSRPTEEFASDDCIHRLFERQAARHPDRLALSFDGAHLSYQELNGRANRLAHRLLALGLPAGSPVALLLEPSVETVVALLGVLKAGLAYLPLDVAYPPERLAFMLDDARAHLLVTTSGLRESLPDNHPPLLLLDADPSLAEQSAEDCSLAVSADAAAYVIYTSGSTGRPKGVVVTHRNVARLMAATEGWYSFGPSDVWTLFHSYAFDFSVWELWGALLYGGRLVVVPFMVSREPEAFYELLLSEGVTVLNQTPSAFRQLIEAEGRLERSGGAEARRELALRLVVFGGEALELQSLRPWFARHGDERPQLVNMYGITETTVHVTYRPIRTGDIEAGRGSVIGEPIPDMQLYVLDASMEPVPYGVAGELYVGGAGGARGYLNRPSLTAQRFIPDPFGAEPGGRLYRTGDLARRLTDGELEYVGRSDEQVKVRGFRIELGEIESALLSHPQVRQCSVMARADRGGEKRLVAYVVREVEQDERTRAGALNVTALREHLRQHLPDYMLPAAFVEIERMPLTPNGKLDRRALPEPEEGARLDTAEEYAGPRTRAEEILCGVWSEVLGVERVGIDDDFFALGGDSIRSVQVLAQAEKRGVSFTLQQLFRHQTIRELAAEARGEEASTARAARAAPFGLIPADDREKLGPGVADAYPVTMLQLGMLFHSAYHPEEATYHNVNSFRLRLPFDARAFEEAIARVVARHDVLRTAFDLTGYTEPLQLVYESVPTPLAVEDIRRLSGEEQEELLAAWFESEKQRPFDWTRAPLIRFHVHRRSEEVFQFGFTEHHAILDGWSVASMLTELFQTYTSLGGGGAGVTPPPPAVEFRDFVALERAALKSEEARDYWSRKLDGSTITRLPRATGDARSLTQGQDENGGKGFQKVDISAEVNEGLKRLAQATGSSLKSVLLAAHVRVMSLMSGQPDVLTGLVTNGRPEEADGERTLGLFLNTLPLRVALDGGTWRELVRGVFEAETEMLAHRRFPLAELQRMQGGEPLFETLFNYTHFHVYESLPPTDETESLDHRVFAETNFPFEANFELDVRGTRVGLMLTYDPSEFNAAQAEAIGGYYARTLSAMADTPDARYEHCALLSQEELRRQLSGWSGAGEEDTHVPSCVHQLFEAQAARTPDAVALVSENGQLSYRQLDTRANQLAHHLRRLGVGPEARVCILMGRSPELIVAVLAVLKAGGAYVPIDPAYPQQRISYMLSDAGARLVLTEERLRASLPAHDARVVLVDAGRELFDEESADNPVPAATPDNTAYMIYTSGSTGMPKAVAIQHASIASYTEVAADEFALAHDDRLLQFSSISFDTSAEEIFTTLARGAALVLRGEDMISSPARFVGECGRLGLTVLDFPTAYWHTLVNELAADGLRLPDCVRLVVIGGESALPEKVSLWHRHAGTRVRLLNAYGPTEATIAATMCDLSDPSRAFTPSGGVPIGTPVRGTETYVLDQFLRPVPAGVAGELCVGGRHLARGYFNNPDKTAEKFVPHPFGDVPGARLYRTGDRARYLPDGRIEMLGRIDGQLKIRGFRIETGEIEAVLSQHPDVGECAVVAHGDEGEKRLAAYVVAARQTATLVGDLRDFLKDKLPHYMVPAAFVPVERLPLTPNGKLDRRALPAPEHARDEALSNYVAPRTPAEELLAAVFSEVLKVQTVGVHDNFFELGGHSLLATQVVLRVQRAFAVALPLRTLFERPTVAELADAVRTLAAEGQSDAIPPDITRQNPVTRHELAELDRLTEDELALFAERAPLSFAQQRLWFLDRLRPGDPLYNVPAAVRLTGQLDVHALERAFAEVVARHDALRTVFPAFDGRPLQIVTPSTSFTLPVVDLSDMDEAGREARVQELAGAEARFEFDLAQGPLYRVSLLRLGAQEHVLLLTLHHIVSDGWSIGVLVNEVAALYRAFARGESSPLPELPIQYTDYARWQRGWLRGDVLENQLNYWKNQLAGIPPVLELPTDRPRPAARTHEGATFSFQVGRELSEALASLSRREGVTTFMTLLAAFQTLLARYSRQDDIAVGTAIAGRSRVETEGLIGFFINTLVLRTDLSGDPTFAELLSRAREVTLGAYAHQDIPFEKLVEELQPERSSSHTPLFQVMLVLQNTPDEVAQVPGLRLEQVEGEQRSAKFDLMLTFTEGREGLAGTFEYSVDLFDEPTVARMADHFARLLEELVAHPQERIGHATMLSEREREELLNVSRPTEEFASDACIHRLFEQQAARHPDRLALSFDGVHLSYRELNERANRLAHLLRSLGLPPQAPVALLLEPSVETVVALLGVLKAGLAYLPLDVAYPPDRLAFMLEDARARLLVTTSDLAGRLPDNHPPLLLVDADERIDEQSAADCTSEATADAAAYVIYTSGSTGRPKGVVVTHRNVARLMAATAGWYSFGPADVWTLFHSYAFDFSVWELWGALLYGGRLVVVPFMVTRSPESFHELLVTEGVTVLNQTPSAFRQLARVDEERGGADELSLRLVIFGGEALELQSLRPWFDRHGDERPRLVNMYGITETTVHVTYRPIRRTDVLASRGSVIGEPIPDMQLYVLDAYMQPAPYGVAGELYVGGAGGARGYLNRPGLTAQRFIPDPFGTVPGGRLYRTGDLARRLSDGELEYVGRSDEQVKVRGFRIELGEIEAALVQHPRVSEAVVLARVEAAGEKRVVAYLVASQEVTTGELRSHLKERLPEYMVPSAFVLMEKLPLTPNGKLDRRALPAPAQTRDALEDAFVAPRNKTEETLARIWAEVLGLDRVGVHDNFFELGGHSLLATQVIPRVQKALSVAVPLRALFERPTVAELADAVQSLAAEGQSDGGPLEITRQGAAAQQELAELDRLTEDELALFAERAPLSFAQQRLWFLDRLRPGDPLYNVPAAVRLTGDLDLRALEKSFAEVVARHDALRTVFPAFDGRPLQLVTPPQPFTLPVLDLSMMDEAGREARVRQLADDEARFEFDLAQGPLYRVTLLRLAAREHVVLLTLHHIISDGWSMSVLVREVGALYEAFTAGRPSPLPELPVQYADYARWQRGWLRGDVLENQLSYWKNQLAGLPPVLELPTDRPRPAVRTHEGASFDFEIGAEVSEALATLSRREGVTTFMTLLAAFQTLLARYSRQDDIAVGTAIAGRTRAETEPLIGFFINTLVLRTDLSGDPTFVELLGRAREVTLGAYAHQDIPFEKLVEELQPERSASHTPLFQVMLVLQNTPVGSLELPGLKMTGVESENDAAKFDLTLALEETGRGLGATFSYNTGLFEAATVERLARHFRSLLESIADDPSRRLSEIPLLDDAERHRLLVEWNDTANAYAADRCVHELFEEQARRDPEALAVAASGRRVTYGELNERADRLARRLRASGVGPEVLTCVLAGRSIEMVVGLLAIMKAGGAYVPLDPSYPSERLDFMLRDARPAVLLTDERSARGASASDAFEVIRLDGVWEETARRDGANPSGDVNVDNLAYVIYTSGSTGRPKGTQITHRSLLNLIQWHQSAYRITPGDRATQLAGVGFDASVWELWPYLTAGASVHLPDEETRTSPQLLRDWLTRERITVGFLPTPLAEGLLALEWPRKTALRSLLTGGDQLHHYPSSSLPFELANHYGPTESTVVTSFAVLPALGDAAATPPPIGRPIANTRVYLLDEHLRPVPVGAPGELHIGGAGLARGYLNRAALTAERFIPNPFGDEVGGRLYKTGDLARYLPDGQIEFLGRIDTQVKIRGFRIELGEIEAVLGQHPSVRESVVMATGAQGEEKRLAAYLVAVDGQPPSASELRSFLLERLPEYMVPSAFVNMERLPLTPNGKLDRRALPSADFASAQAGAAYVAPRDLLELRLSRVWEEVLNVRPVGARDNFFALGGHSLSAVRLMARVSNLFGEDVPLAALFQAPTVEELARLVRRQATTTTTTGASSLVELQGGGDARPFFCVHPVGGNVFSYVPLARHLGAVQPFYGLQSLGLVEGETPLARVEEMAAHYVESLRAVQPAGPYTLAGWSMGGVVAYEMARQLEAAGESVSRLLLFDVAAPATYNALPEEGEGARLLGFAQDLGLSLNSDDLAAFAQSEPEEMLARLLRRAQSSGAVPPDITEARARRLFNVFKSNSQALRDYVAPSYGGSLELFVAAEGAGREVSEEWACAWRALARGGVTLRAVPGDHHTMWREPNVRVLADEVKSVLEASRADEHETAPLAHA